MFSHSIAKLFVTLGDIIIILFRMPLKNVSIALDRSFKKCGDGNKNYR